MEKARKRIWICLACVVVIAVAVGMIYYFCDVQGTDEVLGGTLVRITGGSSLCQQAGNVCI